MSDSTVLTLRKETTSANSCGDPLEDGQLEGFLPLGCGAEAVFNFSLEKEILPDYSGLGVDDDDDEYEYEYEWTTQSPKSIGTVAVIRTTRSTPATVRPTASVISTTRSTPTIRPTASVIRTTRSTTMSPRPTASVIRTTRSTTMSPRPTASVQRTTRSIITTSTSGSALIPVTPNRSAPRLPPRFTASPEDRHSSFQHLLRMHLNTFNQRLSMLESNTLDMKESIHAMQEHQSLLSAKLDKLLTLKPAAEKKEKVVELESSYTDMEFRLSKLEGRLEILIDGFTALAQEMNKIKRTRHTSRSPQERRALPVLNVRRPTSAHTTPHPTIRITTVTKPLTNRATVPKSLPTPRLPASKSKRTFPRDERPKTSATTTSTSQPVRKTVKVKLVASSSKSQVPTQSAPKLQTTLSKPRITSRIKPQATVKPETKPPASRKPVVTAERASKPRQVKPKQAIEERATSKYQLEPPSHKHKPATNAPKNPPKRQIQANETNAAPKRPSLSSDAPATKKVQQGVNNAAVSRTLPQPNLGSAKQPMRKTQRNAHKLVASSHKNLTSQNSTVTVTSTPTTVTTTKATAATTTKLPKTTTEGKSKPSSSKKKQQKKNKKKTRVNANVVDLLKLLKGDHKLTKDKLRQDGSLHVVLGRLAIPIRIIPDD